MDESDERDEYQAPLALHPDLAGKCAIVTGAARNIGTAIAANLAAQGMQVVLADVDGTVLDRVAARLRGLERDCVAVAADLATPAGADAVMAVALKAHGRVDALVNNAAIREGVPLLEADDASWGRAFEANMRMAQLLSRRVARHMVDAGIPGAFVHITSIGATRPHRYCADYDAYKAALEGFSRVLADNLAGHGIRSNCVAPGATATRRGDGPVRRELHPVSTAIIPLSRRAEMTEIAAAVAFLLSAASGYTTGAVLPVDGGLAMRLTDKDRSI